MKKLYSLLVLLFVGALTASEAWAEDYDLRVAGVKVTSDNASKITGTGITGTVSYNNSTKTLTLKNATIKCETSGAIVNLGIAGLTILVNGNSEVTSDYNAIYCNKSTYIRSDNFSYLTVKANNADFCGIWMKEDNALTIEDIWVNITAANPLFGDGMGPLYLNRCNVMANGTTDGKPCVRGFTRISTSGVTYDYNGYTYSETSKRMEDGSGNIVKSHTFKPRISVGQYIWDVRYDHEVTSSSPRAGVSSGTITYNSNSHTLTLDNVTMSSGSFVGIRYYGPNNRADLNIEVKGSNTISIANGSGSEGIFANGNGVNIYGSGTEAPKLTINNTLGTGIRLETAREKTLSINDLTLNITSEERRSIDGGGTAKLSIYNSSVDAAYGILGFADCTLTASYVYKGGEFSPTLKGFTIDGNTIYDGEVQIYTGYALIVCGKRVTESNKNDIIGSGQFSYDTESNTLTLKNAAVSYKGNCISNRLEGLIIKVEGSASLTSTEAHAIYSTKRCTLTSDTFADVTIKSTSSDNFAALYMDGDAQMTISKVWLEATATYPIYGNSGSRLTLALCNVYAKSTGGKPCVAGFGEIVTSGVIYDYDGVTYDTDKNRMANSNGEALTAHTMKPRMAVRKYIWDPRNNKAIDSNTPGAGLAYGTISYSSGTLTLTDVRIDADKYSGISYYGPSYEQNLTIKLKGDNAIYNSSGSSGYPIFCYGNNLTICADTQSPNSPTPELSLNPSNAAAICIKGDKTLTIKDIIVDIPRTTAFYSLYGSSTADLVIEDCEMSIGYGISGFKSMTMRACDIAEPEGAWFSPSLKGVTADGTKVYGGKVVISDVSYGINIGETKVMASNADDILGDGHFSYDSPTKTLTVSDADLENVEGALGSGISNRKIDGLTINLEGNNHITVRNSVIYSDKNINIKGTGALTAKSNHSALYFGSEEDINCTIDGPTLILKSQIPISDYYTHTTLVLKGDKTYIALEPKEYYNPITDLKGLTTYWPMDIVKPEGAWFSASLKGITLDGEKLYEGKVVFFGGNLADVNRDTSVDVADIASVIDAMAGTGGEILRINADVNLDGTVDVADIAAVIDVMAAQ